MKASEHAIQSAVFSWVLLKRNSDPRYLGVFSVPNGAHLARVKNKRGEWYCPQINRLKAEGLTTGAPDIVCLVRRREWGGLVLEFKDAKGTQSDDQIKMQHALEMNGFAYQIVRDVERGIWLLDHWMTQAAREFTTSVL